MDTTTFTIEAIGWIGALLILAAYILLSTERIQSRSLTYQTMNVVGSAGFVINSGWNGAIPSAALNVVWLFVGTYALWNIKKRSSTSATSSQTE
jgi:formate hydrogenlyase subunit 3/multisubunit Na+/H+ antiporter MnhD subunit